VGNTVQPPGPTRILVVETDEDDRRTVAGYLTEAGYDVSTLRGGQEAYEHTMLSDYDLILTDLWLVGMDGFEMIEAMRKSGVTSPIVVRTAYITRDMVRELLEWRVSKIVLKSAQKDTLLSSVREIVPMN
jgi:DNA-binding response OmpR family regulator